MMSFSIYLKAIPQEMLNISNFYLGLKFINLMLKQYYPGENNCEQHFQR